MKIDKSKILSGCFERFGRACTVTLSSGEQKTVHAVVEQVWRRLKSKFEPTASLIGLAYTDYYMYYGPCDFDITKMTGSDILEFNGTKCYFVRAESVVAGDNLQYYSGVLKKIYEEDENVFG